MSPRDLLLALVVVFVWGVNFVVIKVGLHGVPPLLLGALRFVFVVVPSIFFVPRPPVPWRWLLAYGLVISFLQFALLFSAINLGMPAGLASLVLQAQAFFTLVFARLFLGETIRATTVAGYGVAAVGLAVIGTQLGHAMTLAGFMLTLAAAVSWSVGNIITRRIGKVDPMGLVVWGGLVPPLPFLAMSWLLEGPTQIRGALAGVTITTGFSVAYLSFASTLVGYGLWSRLLARYPAGSVAPFSLLVPVVGLTSAWLLLGEQLTVPQFYGIVLVLAGLAFSTFAARFPRLAGVRPAAAAAPAARQRTP